MPLFFFILLNAVLLLRPADLIPELRGLGIYYGVLLLAWLAVLPRLAQPAARRWLFAHPTSWCVLGLQAAVVLSHLSHGQTFEAREGGLAFLDIPLFYFLLLLVLDTPARLRRFLPWLCLLIAVQTGIAMLEYYEVIHLEALSTLLEQKEYNEETGEYIVIPRLCGLGFFHDPNDLCLLLVVGMGIAGWLAASRGRGLARLLFLACLLFFAYGVVLTQSRGGLLGVLAGLAGYAWLRWGWRKAALVGTIAVPLLLALLSGRLSQVSTTEGTAQHRIQLWSESLLLFRSAPLFGIGTDRVKEELGLVTHNSFLHSYAEMGFLGGTLFLAAFALTLRSLVQVARASAQPANQEWRRLALFLFACTAGCAVGMLSLSRVYIAFPYIVLGLGVVHWQQAAAAFAAPPLEINGRLLAAAALLSCLFLALMQAYVVVSVVRG